MKKEARILKEILLALSKEFHPGVFWRQNAGTVRTESGTWVNLGPVGISDIVGIVPPGRAVFIETKRKDGKQREAQKRWQRAVERVGGIYLVARSPEEAIAGVKKGLEAARAQRPTPH